MLVNKSPQSTAHLLLLEVLPLWGPVSHLQLTLLRWEERRRENSISYPIVITRLKREKKTELQLLTIELHALLHPNWTGFGCFWILLGVGFESMCLFSVYLLLNPAVQSFAFHTLQVPVHKSWTRVVLSWQAGSLASGLDKSNQTISTYLLISWFKFSQKAYPNIRVIDLSNNDNRHKGGRKFKISNRHMNRSIQACVIKI